MPNDREHLEQELRAKAEEAIQKLLKALPDKSQITMSDMEMLTGEMGREIVQGTLQSLGKTQGDEPDEVSCEACGCLMHKRGKRKKRIVTMRGEMEIERQYYVCPTCGVGTFPPR